MTNFMKDKAKRIYEEGCNLYLRLFCEKHGYDADSQDTWWVGNDVGGVAGIGDLYADMATIRADIDKDAPEEEFLKWYDYCTEAHCLGLSSPNYVSWLMGCPRQYDEMERIRELKKECDKIIREFKNKEDYDL